jgi:hypothetical protein
VTGVALGDLLTLFRETSGLDRINRALFCVNKKLQIRALSKCQNFH